MKRYGVEFKQTLVYDRIKQHLREFCANNTIDDVYNTCFLLIDYSDDVDVLLVLSVTLMFITKSPFKRQQQEIP